MFNKEVLIPIIVCVVLVILFIILVVSLLKKPKNKEDEISILDINEEGVPNSSEDTNFSYGYEKEETIVMDKVEVPKEENNDETKKEDEGE